VVNGTSQTITGSGLLGLIKKAMRIETIWTVSNGGKEPEIIRILPAMPPSVRRIPDPGALTRVVTMVGKALGDRLEGSCTEMDQEHGRWKIVLTSGETSAPDHQHRPGHPPNCRVSGDQGLLEPGGGPRGGPYRVGSEEGDGGALEKGCETVGSLSALIDC